MQRCWICCWLHGRHAWSMFWRAVDNTVMHLYVLKYSMSLDPQSALILTLNGTSQAHLEMLETTIIARVLEQKWLTFGKVWTFVYKFILVVSNWLCLSVEDVCDYPFACAAVLTVSQYCYLYTPSRKSPQCNWWTRRCRSFNFCADSHWLNLLIVVGSFLLWGSSCSRSCQLH